jgi:hypothetical protein
MEHFLAMIGGIWLGCLAGGRSDRRRECLRAAAARHARFPERPAAGARAVIWRPSHRGHTPARLLADRHYSRQKPGSSQFMPAGSCRVLLAANARSVFGLSFPKPEFVKHAWAGAWIVSIFRNEEAGPLASDMIRDALAIMQSDFGYGAPPALGCVTFVNPKMVRGVLVRGERVKGFCFQKAGFRAVGETKKGLIAFQLLPHQMPAPAAIGKGA